MRRVVHRRVKFLRRASGAEDVKIRPHQHAVHARFAEKAPVDSVEIDSLSATHPAGIARNPQIKGLQPFQKCSPIGSQIGRENVDESRRPQPGLFLTLYPFDVRPLKVQLRLKHLSGTSFDGDHAFRKAYYQANNEGLEFEIN